MGVETITEARLIQVVKELNFWSWTPVMGGFGW